MGSAYMYILHTWWHQKFRMQVYIHARWLAHVIYYCVAVAFSGLLSRIYICAPFISLLSTFRAEKDTAALCVRKKNLLSNGLRFRFYILYYVTPNGLRVESPAKEREFLNYYRLLFQLLPCAFIYLLISDKMANFLNSMLERQRGGPRSRVNCASVVLPLKISIELILFARLYLHGISPSLYSLSFSREGLSLELLLPPAV